MRPRAVIPALAALVVAGCGFGFVADQGSFLGTRWSAVSILGLVPAAGHAPSLRLGPETLSGSGGCNDYESVTLVLELPTIRFGGLAVDDAVCEDGRVMALEEVFLDSLLAVDTMAFRDGRLVLSGAPGELIFEQIRDSP